MVQGSAMATDGSNTATKSVAASPENSSPPVKETRSIFSPGSKMQYSRPFRLYFDARKSLCWRSILAALTTFVQNSVDHIESR
jgi:hypothetical protein